ncbi:MAG: hypothetical protein Kow0099_24940 [Candidatus Abyssubacteria bacterium]
MKATTVLAIVLFCLLPFSPFVHAVPLDVSSGGVEISGPAEITVHNGLIGSNYYSGVFNWNPRLNVWIPTGYGSELFTFRASEYYPLDQGRSWTYTLSSGGTLTLAVNGTDQICDLPCIRLEASDGSVTNWISDDTGIWMTRYANPDGSRTLWCPPMKVTPPQLYLGTQSLYPFTDAPFGMEGYQFGSHDGWSSFVVKGIEDLTVPAGVFTDCLRATFVYNYTDTWSGMVGLRTEEIWFAQGVGMVKRIKTEVAALDSGIFGSAIEIYLLQSYSVPE